MPDEHSTSAAVGARLVARFDVEAVDRDRPGLALDLLAFAGELVEAGSVDLHGRHHRRDLLDGAGEAAGGRGDIGQRHVAHVVLGGDDARVVEGVGLDAEHDLTDVGLGLLGHETQQAGGTPDAEHEHPGGGRIEGAAVTHLAGAEDAAGLRHDVVGGPAHFLVDDAEAVHVGVRPSRTHPFSRSSRRISSTREAVSTTWSSVRMTSGVRRMWA